MAIGIRRERVSAQSVWCELFQELDVTALEQALGEWVQGEASLGHVAIDGKRRRGSATAQAPGTHLLAASSDRLQGVIGQSRADPDSNEITAALQLLKTLPLKGVTIAEHARPFAKGEIGRDDHRGPLIEAADQMEQELSASLGERQIADV
jgi:hypothetical protein